MRSWQTPLLKRQEEQMGLLEQNNKSCVQIASSVTKPPRFYSPALTGSVLGHTVSLDAELL